MSVEAWAPGDRLTWDDWVAMPEDSLHRYELVEGVLVMVSRPVSNHQRVIKRLCGQLDAQLPPDLEAVPEVEMVVHHNATRPTVRVPDVIVAATSLVDTNPARYRAQDVALAIEVLSPGTWKTDRRTKLAEYARAGVENYWLVTCLEPISVISYRLIGDAYQLDQESSGVVSLKFPAPITLDLPTLTASRS